MNAEKLTRDSHPESTESGMDELLQKAASLQQLDPEQALIIISRITELAVKNKLVYYLAAAKKICGNVHFLLREYDLAKKHYLSALTSAKKADNPKLTGDIYYNLGRVFTKLQDYPAALKHLQKSLTYRRNLVEKKDESSSLNHIGQVFWEMQDFQQAAVYFQKSAEVCDSSVGTKQIATIYNNLGNAYIKTEEIPKAMEAYIYSLKLKETIGDAADLATAKLNLGNLYYTATDFTNALGYYQEAGRLYINAGDKAREAIVYSNLGATYNALNNFDQAALYHLKALEFFQLNGMREDHAKTLNNIGAIYQHKAEYHKAIQTYQESLRIKSAFYNSESLAITHHNLSECYYSLGENHAALHNTQKSMSYSQQIKSKTMLMKNYALLSKIYAALNDFQNAYEALNVHRLLDLEVYGAENKSILADMMAHYDAEGKAKEIELLKSDHQALEELVSQQAKDKIRYLKLYRSKLDEVKMRLAIQEKLEQMNADLESKIEQALQDYRAQEQIIIQKSKLESLGVMAAGMAHEINQPLSAISMGLNNLRIKAQRSELSEAYLNDKIRKLTEDIQRIRSVIEHVRQFSRDQVNSNPEQIDIHQTLRDAVALIAYDLGRHQIKLRMLFTQHNLTTVGSKFKLEQVFLNLIVNGRDAIQEKIKTEGYANQEYLIDINTSVHKDSAEIVFCDNGTGMSESSLGKMFDPFFTTKSPERGTGLGLSISYGIILEMGGKITVDSKLGKFTKITVVLPILEEQK
ncbi:MAG: tetratricopeptide repeat protein [Candidatus Cloacimonas sp.]|nr:tetratricopeptide repeat protein [Candidatus Cloacimonas sp.]